MFFLLQGPMQNYSLMSATHSVGTGNSTTLAAFKLVTGVARRRGWKWGEDVQSGAGLGACCNNSNANVALDPRAERSHKHMQTSSPRLCGARRRDKQGILVMKEMPLQRVLKVWIQLKRSKWKVPQVSVCIRLVTFLWGFWIKRMFVDLFLPS